MTEKFSNWYMWGNGVEVCGEDCETFQRSCMINQWHTSEEYTNILDTFFSATPIAYFRTAHMAGREMELPVLPWMKVLYD
jgi:hypothetical protein